MVSKTLPVYWDEAFLDHEPPSGAFELESTDLLAVDEPHPDKRERILNIKNIIEEKLSDHAVWESVEPARREQLVRVHERSYIDYFKKFCEYGGGRLTADTGANEDSYRAAKYSAGASIQTAERALENGIDDVPYALVRPSGHHAQPDRADGFCFFNNAGVGTEHVIATGQAERVAIIDWDVHHGNGTQEIFYDRDDVLFISLHHDHGSWDPEAHPQTGGLDETGRGKGEGYNVNIPLPPGIGDRAYTYVFDNMVDPIVSEFKPDLILVSAGQDPGIMDPLGRNLVTKVGFRELGESARSLARKNTDGHLGIIQEGGYQISHLAYATLGVLEGALGVDTGVDDPFDWLDENFDPVIDWVREASEVYSEYWPVEVD